MSVCDRERERQCDREKYKENTIKRYRFYILLRQEGERVKND